MSVETSVIMDALDLVGASLMRTPRVGEMLFSMFLRRDMRVFGMEFDGLRKLVHWNLPIAFAVDHVEAGKYHFRWPPIHGQPVEFYRGEETDNPDWQQANAAHLFLFFFGSRMALLPGELEEKQFAVCADPHPHGTYKVVMGWYGEKLWVTLTPNANVV